MIRFRLLAILGAVLCWSGVGLAPVQAQETVPLAEYGKLPDVERSAISPSGDRIALLTTIEGKRLVLALEDQTTPLRVINVGDMKIRSLRWIGEERLFITTSQTEDLGYGFTTDKFEFEVGRVLPVRDGLEGGLIFGGIPKYVDTIFGNYGVRKIGGSYYGFFGGLELARRTNGTRAGYQFDHGRPHLFKVNLETFKVKKVSVAANQGFEKDWIIDAEGRVAYTLDINNASGAWVIRNADGDRIVGGKQARGAVSLIGLGFDGKSAVYVERGDDRSYWWEIGQEGGEPQPFLDDIGFERLFWNRETGSLMGYTIGEDENERHVFANKELQKKAERVRQAFATYESWMSDWTGNLSDVIVRTSGNGDSGTFYAVDLATNRANAIAYERLAIGPEAVGPISTFEYTASDGTEMDGILTLPPGKEPTNLPVVMLPHGGPHSADSATFDWWAQAFASRGYAVFQPNFRGSTNRGASFRRAGYGEWGRKMQTDKSDGLMALAQSGIVDPSRACIVGASYGGYAALAGVTLQQGIYRCAVSVNGVTELESTLRDLRTGTRDIITRSFDKQFGPNPDLDALSPVNHADKADAPILLIHGRDDTVVPYGQSVMMRNALKGKGKEFEFVELEGEDHFLSQSDTRMQMLDATMAFVQKHNPAD